jgi:DNA-binding NtrC family response regulator
VPEHLALAPDELALGELPAAAAVPSPFAPESTNVKVIERQLIEQVLRECQGNKSKAARRLGLTRKQLYVRLRQYDAQTA